MRMLTSRCANINSMAKTKQRFSANYKKDGRLYLGWVEEIPGVNTQGETLKEARENLKDALRLVLDVNKTINRDGFGDKNIIRESISF